MRERGGREGVGEKEKDKEGWERVRVCVFKLATHRKEGIRKLK